MDTYNPILPNPVAPRSSLSRKALLAYGCFNLPLAFVALPLYVLLPAYYAQHHGLSLAWLGSVLLASRLLDALFDPLLGAWLDRPHPTLSLAAKRQRALVWGTLLLGLGMGILLGWPPSSQGVLLSALTLGLMLTYAGFSLCTIAYQAWGAELGDDAAQRAQVTTWREALGLLGVLLAALLPTWLGVAGLWWPFAALLGLGLLALLRYAPRPFVAAHLAFSQAPTHAVTWWQVLQRRPIRQLLSVFILNGIASAIPATLFLFYVRDALQLQLYEGGFLLLYFLAGAAAMPLWAHCAKRFGLVHAWLLGMALALISFVWVLALPQPTTLWTAWGFAGVCVLSGMALGADLALPAAILAGLLRDSAQAPSHTASSTSMQTSTTFGLWNFCNKLNLALAAGLALPLLALWGYQPNQTLSPHGLSALTWAYCGLPCLLKSLAALRLGWLRNVLSPPSISSHATLEHAHV